MITNSELRHTTAYTAINKKCDCNECVEYRRKYMREYKSKYKTKERNENAQISAQQIKDALVEVAGFFGRPNYDLVVVRDVIKSFRSDEYHSLKRFVMRELELSKPVLSKQKNTIKAENKVKPKELNKLKTSDKVLKHGTSTRYLLGCRCEECMEWA